MNISIFNTCIQRSFDVLKYASLYREKGVKDIGEVSDEFKNTSIKGNYLNIYQTAIHNLDYDILLQDESFFQFSYTPTGQSKLPLLRFAYFQNPKDIVSYEQYIEEQLNSNYAEVGDSFIEEYGQYVTEAELNSNATMIRYDLDCKSYKPLIHATSHLHIGNGENIRIPCSKTMTPLTFVIFVIKHIYYNNWKYLIDNYETFDKEFFSLSKKQCEFIHPLFWKVNPESNDYFLS